MPDKTTKELRQAAVWGLILNLVMLFTLVAFVLTFVTWDRRWGAAFISGWIATWILKSLWRRLFPQVVAGAQAEVARMMAERRKPDKSIEDRAIEIVQERTGWPAYMAERHEWDQAVTQAKKEQDGNQRR